MINKLYKVSIYLMSFILIMSLCFTMSFAETKDQYNFKLAFVDKFWEGEGYNAQRLVTAINYTSGDKIRFVIFPNAELGEVQESLEALQLGKIDMTVVSNTKLASFTNRFSIFDTPFLFPDYLDEIDFLFASADKHTPATEKILEQASKETGMHFLSVLLAGRKGSCFTRPVRSWEDAKGLKMRLMPNNIQMDAWGILGLNPMSLAWSELYTSLQTKVVDGCELTGSDYLAVSFYDVAPYWVNTNHLNYTESVVMSEKAWNSLSPNLQGIVKEAAVRTAYLESLLSLGFTEGLLRPIEMHAKEFVVFDANTQKKAREQVLPKLLDKYKEEIGIDSLVQLAKKDEVVRQWCIENGLKVE